MMVEAFDGIGGRWTIAKPLHWSGTNVLGNRLPTLICIFTMQTRTVLTMPIPIPLQDNVEQVKMPEGYDGTVYILIVYNTYDPEDDYSEDDYLERTYFEKFGLALPSKFTRIDFSSMDPPSPQP